MNADTPRIDDQTDDFTDDLTETTATLVPETEVPVKPDAPEEAADAEQPEEAPAAEVAAADAPGDGPDAEPEPAEKPEPETPAEPEPTGPRFADLGLSDAVLAGLDRIGYEQPSPIQAAIIPAVLSGVDVIGQAQTGTGKTAAFALPILSKLTETNGRFDAPSAPSRWSSPPPASSRFRSPRPSRPTPRSCPASTSCPSTAGPTTPRSCGPSAAAFTSSSARPAACSTT